MNWTFSRNTRSRWSPCRWSDKIAGGETVEIRLEIKAEGNFSGTVYTLRYFQPDGKGSLKMEDGTVLKPNDRYLLNERKFRLYYTSQSDKEAQTIDLYFEDNWGNLQRLTYDFNAEDSPRLKRIIRGPHGKDTVHFDFLSLVLCKAEDPPSMTGKGGFQHQTVGRLAPGENALHRLRTPPAPP